MTCPKCGTLLQRETKLTHTLYLPTKEDGSVDIPELVPLHFHHTVELGKPHCPSCGRYYEQP